MLNLNSLMIGTMQPKVMAAFYEQVIGKKPDMEEEGWYGLQVGASFFGLGHHSKMEGQSKDAGRVMYNFESKNVQADFDRIKAIPGAVVIKEPYEMGKLWIATFADPDGNYFQLMSPWKA